MERRNFFIGQFIQDLIHGFTNPTEFAPLLTDRNTKEKKFYDVGTQNANSVTKKTTVKFGYTTVKVT
jgi:hypothetical protein